MSPPATPTGTATVTTAVRTTRGIQPVRIQATVEASAIPPRWSLTGLADDDHTIRDRIRAAIINSGQTWPQGSLSLTVVGQPLPTPDSGVDLACALALLAAADRIPAEYLDQVACCGEVGLDGTLRDVRDLDQRIMALHQAGFHRLILPAAQAPISHPGPLVIWAPTTLREIIEPLRLTESAESRERHLDQVLNPRLRRIAMIAAAGGHHLFLTGCVEEHADHVSQVLTGLLPNLDDQAARDVDDLHWQAGWPRSHRLRRRPPSGWSPPALSAGTLTRPGPASLAHHGVYCPADADTLTADQLSVLRSVLDQRRVLIRAPQGTRSWPARTQLVLATNDQTPAARLRPLADRIDLHLHYGIPRDFAIPSQAGVDGALACEQIARARAAAAQRWSPQAPAHPVLNAEVTPEALRRTLQLLPGAYLRSQADTARLSPRGWVGVLRLAWTIADLAGRGHPTRRDVDEAIAWRTSGLGRR